MILDIKDGILNKLQFEKEDIEEAFDWIYYKLYHHNDNNNPKSFDILKKYGITLHYSFHEIYNENYYQSQTEEYLRNLKNDPENNIKYGTKFLGFILEFRETINNSYTTIVEQGAGSNPEWTENHEIYSCKSQIKKIGPYALANNDNLIMVLLDTGETKLSEGSFYNCPKLNNIIITNVSYKDYEFPDYCFARCGTKVDDSYYEVNFNEGDYYTDDSGNTVQMTSNKKVKIYYDNLVNRYFNDKKQLNISMPYGLTKIGKGCFMNSGLNGFCPNPKVLGLFISIFNNSEYLTASCIDDYYLININQDTSYSLSYEEICEIDYNSYFYNNVINFSKLKYIGQYAFYNCGLNTNTFNNSKTSDLSSEYKYYPNDYNPNTKNYDNKNFISFNQD